MNNPIKLCLALLSACICLHAQALPAMDVEAGVLMAQSDDLKQALKLTPNQLTLWRQTESKMRSILDERRRRRDRLQDDLKRGVSNPQAELRDLAKLYDAEADASYREDKQLRELFLAVNDALDDTQRQAILSALNDQLQRVPDRGGDGPKSSGQQQTRGMGRHGGAGGGGPPGGGTPPQQ